MTHFLEELRAGRALTAKARAIHDAALVGVLASLHDEIDREVLAAYGWRDLDGQLRSEAGREQVLARLVALNAERAAQEAKGEVHWLRPEYQCARRPCRPQSKAGWTFRSMPAWKRLPMRLPGQRRSRGRPTCRRRWRRWPVCWRKPPQRNRSTNWPRISPAGKGWKTRLPQIIEHARRPRPRPRGRGRPLRRQRRLAAPPALQAGFQTSASFEIN